MNGAARPITVVVVTRRLDDESPVDARVVLVGGDVMQPRVLDTVFEGDTHARALVKVAGALVRLSGRHRRRLRVVIPDRVVVGLLNGEPDRSNHLGRQIAMLHERAKSVGADCSFEYGSLRSFLGDRADLIDVW